jgi:anthranilate synthase/aminodeoxychorismate synthase-like glutamine amidotransferase
MPSVLLVDAYDSFTYNLVQAFEVLGAAVDVQHCDQLTVQDALAHPATHWVLSPGPGRPREAGVFFDLAREAIGVRPLLGVCLGHQALVEACGGSLTRKEPVHGHASRVHHDGRGLFADQPQPLEMARYHSLVADPAHLPDVLEVSARTEDGTIMAVRHREAHAMGLQFHPESILSPRGPRLLEAFLKLPSLTV